MGNLLHFQKVDLLISSNIYFLQPFRSSCRVYIWVWFGKVGVVRAKIFSLTLPPPQTKFLDEALLGEGRNLIIGKNCVNNCILL